MASSNSPTFLLRFSFPVLLTFVVVILASFHRTLGLAFEEGKGAFKGGGRRVLLGFRESPAGSNVTFECSPSGPCVRCLYSEKIDEKYRCSETGYRIPLKCVETEDSSKGSTVKKSKNSRSVLDGEAYATTIKHRNLLDHSATSQGRSQAYITYRSCKPPANEEMMSVLDFEGIMLGLLLISGSVVYFRRKQTAAMPGVRSQTNSRF